MPAKKRHATLRKDGRWQCKVHGKTIIKTNKNDAIEAADRYEAMLELELVESLKPKTVKVYAGEWLHLHRGSVIEKTFNDYANQMDKLVAVCGEKVLSDVTPDDAAAVWKAYAGLSASTIRRANQLFRGMFDSAVENDYCRKNPFRSSAVKLPQGSAGSHRALTLEEIKLIRNTQHRMRPAVMTMLYAGLRKGEALALTSADIDLKARVIHVSKAVRYDSNQPILTDPKTAAGIRDVPILSDLLPILRKVTGPLAPSASGKLMSDTAFSRAWDSYLLALSRAAGHPVTIRPHDLRHTYCTILCDAGVPIKQAMEWLGHADEKMILKIYDHNSTARRAASTVALEAHLHPKRKNRVSKQVSPQPTKAQASA